MAERARSHADALLRKVEDPSSPLSEPGRKVLGYACELAKTRGIDRVALPRRTVMTQTGLGERSVRTALDHLDAAGLLTLVERGKPAPARPRPTCTAWLPIHYPMTGLWDPRVRSVGPVPSGLMGPPSPLCRVLWDRRTVRSPLPTIAVERP